MQGQTSVEYLLLVAGVILIAVIVGYYVVSSSVSANRQMISSEHPSVSLTATALGSGMYVVICSASDVSRIASITIIDGSVVKKTCNPDAYSAECKYTGAISSIPALSCKVVDGAGHVITAHVS